MNPNLQQAAQAKAEAMANEAYFAHTSPLGKTPWQWMDEYGYRYQRAGENLAVNFDTPNDVIEAWLNSPSHRRNLEDEEFTDIGIGVAVGTYQNQPETLYIVAMYGKPVPIVVSGQGWIHHMAGLRDFLDISKL